MSPFVLIVVSLLGWMYFVAPEIWEKSSLGQRLVMMLIVIGLFWLGVGLAAITTMELDYGR